MVGDIWCTCFLIPFLTAQSLQCRASLWLSNLHFLRLDFSNVGANIEEVFPLMGTTCELFIISYMFSMVLPANIADERIYFEGNIGRNCLK